MPALGFQLVKRLADWLIYPMADSPHLFLLSNFKTKDSIVQYITLSVELMPIQGGNFIWLSELHFVRAHISTPGSAWACAHQPIFATIPHES